MGSKKKRHAEKVNKKNAVKEELDNKKTEEKKENTSKKWTALINILICLSILLVLYAGSLNNSSLAYNAGSQYVQNVISHEIKADCTILKTDYEEGRAYSLYETDGNLKLMRFDRHSFLFNRYVPSESYELSDKSYDVQVFSNFVKVDGELDVVIFGPAKKSLAAYAEITYNGQTEKVEFDTNDGMLIVKTFEEADADTAEVKFFDVKGNDVTNEM